MQRGGLWVLAQGGLVLGVVVLGAECHTSSLDARLHVAGLVFLSASALFGLAGTCALGRSLTPFPKPAARAKLVEHGIYGIIRHPLYVSVVSGAVGWSLFRQSWPAAALSAILAVFFDAKARREERWLRQRYEAYAHYERRVRRFLPWVY